MLNKYIFVKYLKIKFSSFLKINLVNLKQTYPKNKFDKLKKKNKKKKKKKTPYIFVKRKSLINFFLQLFCLL